jgi:hypothetical protein
VFVDALRSTGGVAGLLVGIGAAVGFGIALAAPWQVIAFCAFFLGLIGTRIGSRTPPALWEHKLFTQLFPVLGAMGGVFLGIYLVHGIPMRGQFGWRVFACSAALALVGLMLPLVVLSKLVPVRCPRCGGRAYLGTDSTFFRKVLAKYCYRCRSCGHAQEADFSQPVYPDG